ncbi:DnaJ/Hsp40 cysteine-rich domain superfamily protein [Prunus dulcis]|uniref:DnaJ/Hsp40 cysteine-rich domain superfamily protein n=1 Tax=Prunus dulcis TaxID=3755 RepID=A0A5H2XML5_PRUDU|nr:DnaJ/Hsp40 cysteine-rich domain superfamily protein [Prunus dulcis]
MTNLHLGFISNELGPSPKSLPSLPTALLLLLLHMGIVDWLLIELASLRAECSAGDVDKRRSSLESLFCYDTAVPEERIEKPIGISLAEKVIGNKPRCIDCEAKGAILCTTCSGSGLYVDSILESQGIIVKVRCLVTAWRRRMRRRREGLWGNRFGNAILPQILCALYHVEILRTGICFTDKQASELPSAN